MKNNPALEYRQAAVRSASPLGLVGLLYDAALNSLNRAIRAMEAHDVEQRVAALDHVLAIIGHFQQTLDFERGGDVARNLDRFYHASRAAILEATFTQSAQTLKDLAVQFQGLRDAWKEADRRGNAPVAIFETPAAAGGIHWSA
jgi:flagellar protein FliS